MYRVDERILNMMASLLHTTTSTDPYHGEHVRTVWQRTLTGLLIAVLIACIIIVAAAIPRGTDLTDEGLYLVLLNGEQPTSLPLTQYNLVFAFLYDMFGLKLDVIGARSMRLFLTLAVSALVYFSFRRADHIHANGPNGLLICLIAGFMTYTSHFSIQTPGYNFFIYAFAQILLATFVLTNGTKRLVPVLVMSVMVVLLWITKFTTALTVPILLVLAYVVTGQYSTVRSAVLRTLALVGMLASVLVFILSWTGHPISPLDYMENLAKNPVRSHEPMDLIISVLGFVAYGIASLTIGYAIIVKQKDIMQKGLIGTLFVVGAILLFLFIGHRLLEYRSWYLVAISLSSMVIGGLLRKFPPTRAQRPILLILVVMPLALAFGTNAPLFMYCSALFQFHVIAILIIYPGASSRLLLPVLAVLVPFLLYNDLWYTPYRQPPLAESLTPFSVRDRETLLLDSTTVAYLERFSSAMNGYQHITAFGSDRLMGELYYTGSPYPDWLIWSIENATEDYMKHLEANYNELVFILTDSRQSEHYNDLLHRYDMSCFARMDRRAFLDRNAPRLRLSRGHEVNGAKDSLFFFHCVMRDPQLIDQRKP